MRKAPAPCPPDENGDTYRLWQNGSGKSSQLQKERFEAKSRRELKDPSKTSPPRASNRGGLFALEKRRLVSTLPVESRLVMCRPEISTKFVTRKSGNTRTRSSRLTSGVASFGEAFDFLPVCGVTRESGANAPKRASHLRIPDSARPDSLR